MKELFGDFFKNKKILITGHTGFIGSWLAIWLNEMNANVIGYALPPYTKNDNFVVTNLKKKINSLIGDIKDCRKLNTVFEKYKPEIVFHLAAQPIVRKSYKIPKETFYVNIGGTVNIFEAFRKSKSCKVLINFTTDKCYQNKETPQGYKENDRLGGYDPYSSSKACSEIITYAYQQSYFRVNSLKSKKYVSTIRSGNVIGGGDWQENRLIPDCMNAIKNNKIINIRNPESIRPWQYVLEPIYGILKLSVKIWEDGNKFSGPWNFGPDKNSIFSVKDVVEKVIQFMGKGTYTCLANKEKEYLHESKFLILDCSKAQKEINWKPALKFNESLKITCDWYLEENITYEFDVNQINYYIKKIE